MVGVKWVAWCECRVVERGCAESCVVFWAEEYGDRVVVQYGGGG